MHEETFAYYISCDSVDWHYISSLSVCDAPFLQDQYTADDIKFVGEPVRTDDGTLQVAFFAQRPGGDGVVDGDELAEVVNDNSDDISTAVSSTVPHTGRMGKMPQWNLHIYIHYAGFNCYLECLYSMYMSVLGFYWGGNGTFN